MRSKLKWESLQKTVPWQYQRSPASARVPRQRYLVRGSLRLALRSSGAWPDIPSLLAILSTFQGTRWGCEQQASNEGHHLRSQLRRNGYSRVRQEHAVSMAKQVHHASHLGGANALCRLHTAGVQPRVWGGTVHLRPNNLWDIFVLDLGDYGIG
jgi:hypothetical protein